jgi:hypothetical protein
MADFVALSLALAALGHATVAVSGRRDQEASFFTVVVE